jgi:hypothetical protein
MAKREKDRGESIEESFSLIVSTGKLSYKVYSKNQDSYIISACFFAKQS